MRPSFEPNLSEGVERHGGKEGARVSAEPHGLQFHVHGAHVVAGDSEKTAPPSKPAGAGGAPQGKPPQGKPPSIYARPPVPTFYEGILVLESAKGV